MANELGRPAAEGSECACPCHTGEMLCEPECDCCNTDEPTEIGKRVTVVTKAIPNLMAGPMTFIAPGSPWNSGICLPDWVWKVRP